MVNSVTLARIAALALVATAAAATGTGCSRSNPEGFTEQQQKGMDRQATILRDAGGDWNKVSAEDKAFLVQGMGSEESAKQYVRNAGGGGRAPDGQFGPPPGGPPAATGGDGAAPAASAAPK